MKRWGVIGAVALSSLSLSACGSSAPSALARGHQANASTIPWSLVGNKWTLALWNPAKDSTSPTVAAKKSSLFLVDPLGGRYLVGRYNSYSSLMTWSYSLRRVVLSVWQHGNSTIETVGLNNAHVYGRWAVGADTVDQLSVADASGHYLIATVAHGSDVNHPQLEKLSLSGRVLTRYPSSFGAAPLGGSFAVSPTFNEIAAPAGAVAQSLNFSPSLLSFVSANNTDKVTVSLANYDRCSALRWWSSTSVLLACASRSSTERPVLLTVTKSGSIHLLTGPPPGHGLEGDINGWQLKSGLFIQEVSYCGEFVVKYVAPTKRAIVKIPLSTGDATTIVGATDRELLIQSTLGCEPGQSILWYNPVRSRSFVVLGPPLTGGGVQSALTNPRNQP